MASYDATKTATFGRAEQTKKRERKRRSHSASVCSGVIKFCMGGMPIFSALGLSNLRIETIRWSEFSRSCTGGGRERVSSR